MNILRIIKSTEEPKWVKKLFDEGPYTEANAPTYPLRFPLPSKLSKDVTGAYLYVVYAGKIVGYGRIKEVKPHSGDVVGQEKNPVPAGETLFLDGPLIPLPYELMCRGFRRFRYTDVDLHTAGQEAAQKELTERGL